ncbi:hypothetical protein GFV15_04815 [Lactococcus lactis]|nr:hypothetical protein [Lactococcus lactis]
MIYKFFIYQYFCTIIYCFILSELIEIIKVYDFFEPYNLPYNLYDETVKEFQQLTYQQNFAYKKTL